MSDLGLVGQLREHLRTARLLPEPGLAVLAVSGGGDSLAMLDLFAILAPELGLSLLVVHADHGIAPNSAAIAAGVERQARSRYGLETVVGALGLGAGASETRARVARYRLLRAVQASRGARYVFTAHHADDQAETILLRVLRGSAPAGLRGMDACGPRGLVRPLLPFGHAELVAHAEQAGLDVTHDPANLDLRHLRSWVRTQLLPMVLGRLGPEATHALMALGRHAGREVRAWDAVLDALPGLGLHCSDGRFEVARAALRGYDNVLAGRILRAAGWRAGVRLGPAACSRLARFAVQAASGRRLALGAGLVAEAAFDALVVERGAPVPAAVKIEAASGEALFGPYVLAWRSEPAPATVPREGWTTWLASDRLVVRAPRAGDSVAPLGGVGRRKVARLLMEARVPRSGRAGYPVVASGDEVVWIPGVCRAAAAIPDPGREAVRIDARAG
jgi:tRNA(Ile)-lysidine synthetase-like protein